MKRPQNIVTTQTWTFEDEAEAKKKAKEVNADGIISEWNYKFYTVYKTSRRK